MTKYTLICDNIEIEVNESQICYKVDNGTSLTLALSNGQKLEVKK